ncbi:MAG: thioredoxin family protein [Erythrobacter sp.]
MLRIFALIAAIGAIVIGVMQFSARADTTGWQTYDEPTFTMAQAKGQTIVVDVYADWCPTCRAQAPILDEIRKDNIGNEVKFVKVNFDDEKDFLRQHRIPRQSTILVFDGENEIVRTIAETDRSRLRDQVLNAL